MWISRKQYAATLNDSYYRGYAVGLSAAGMKIHELHHNGIMNKERFHLTDCTCVHQSVELERAANSEPRPR